jgi:hypothetical protein
MLVWRQKIWDYLVLIQPVGILPSSVIMLFLSYEHSNLIMPYYYGAIMVTPV